MYSGLFVVLCFSLHLAWRLGEGCKKIYMNKSRWDIGKDVGKHEGN